jgi:hypothetical protein
LKTVINKQTDIGIKILKSDIKNINLGEIEIYLLGSNIKSGISYQKLKQALNEITLAKVAEFANIESNLLARINPTPINVESTLTTGQKSIRHVQDSEIRLFRILDLSSLACLTRTLKHRIRPALKHALDLRHSRS